MGNDFPEDVIYQARLIVARAKFWTPEIEKLLRKWRKQIRQRYLGHKTKEGHYWYWLYGTAIFVILLGTINAVISFGSSDLCDDATSITLTLNGTAFTAFTNSSNGSNSIRFIVGTLSAIAAGVTAISALFDFGGIRKANRDAASDCDALAREIDDLLTQQIQQRGDPIAELQKIRNKFDIIVQNSPSVSAEFRTSLDYASFEKKKHHYNHHKVVKPPSSDVDLKGIRKRKKKVPDVDILTDILVQDLQNAEDEKESIQKENDYDTDDEDNKDRKVTLPFDPENFRPGDILEDDRTRIVRESLQRAMEFELSRLEDSDPNTIYNDRKVSNKVEHNIDPRDADVEKVIDSEDIPMEEIVIDTIENGEIYSEKFPFE